MILIRRTTLPTFFPPQQVFVPLLINPTKDDNHPPFLKKPGDFVIHVGSQLKAKKGSNSLPALAFPLQISYVTEEGTIQCMGVEHKLDKLSGFVHEKKCLRTYYVLTQQDKWISFRKDHYSFNAVQHRRFEMSGGYTCVIPRDEDECGSYAHAD